MAKRATPSQNDQWVACAAVNQAIEKFAVNLASYLVDARINPPEIAKPDDGEKLIEKLMADMIGSDMLTENVTDLPAGAFNRDEAARVALEQIGDFVRLVRRQALHDLE